MSIRMTAPAERTGETAIDTIGRAPLVRPTQFEPTQSVEIDAQAAVSQPGRIGLVTDSQTLIREALGEAHRPCLTCSFQAECVVLVHMVRQVDPAIPVLFLDTFHHFEQTLTYRNELTTRWKLNLITLAAAAPELGLWKGDTQACCRKHKVEPLFAALDTYDLWLTGLRRDSSPTRRDLVVSETFRLPGGTIRKVSPLASWTTEDILAYARSHDIPLLPLYAAGYGSIGCEPCTSLPTDATDPRSGRWKGQKLECGIHLAPTSKEPAG